MAAALTGGMALAQTTAAPAYTPTSLKAEPGVPRTPAGRPDFQGEVWESPYFAGLTGIPFVTPAELVISEAQSKTTMDGLMKMLANFPGIDLDPEVREAFRELKGSPIVRGQRRSRVLVLPADGRLPLTPEAQAEAQKVAASFTTGMLKADNPEDRGTTERCVMQGSAAPFQAPTASNSIQFVQTRDHVVIHTEGLAVYGDEVRIAPFAAEHQAIDIQAPYGDAIARWEGETLVIETIHSPASQRMRVSPFGGGLIVNPGAKITERFTRVSKDEIVYQFTVEDPKVFTAPWLGEFSLFRSGHNRMYGSHCHEGNYSLYNILAGARYEERYGMTLPAWAKDVTSGTAEPAATWKTSISGAADVRSWAVLAPKDAGGLARVGLRIERAQPSSGDKPSLSELNVFEVDCAGQRLRMETQATYAGHNFTGEKTTGAAQGGWAPVATRPAIAGGISQACS